MTKPTKPTNRPSFPAIFTQARRHYFARACLIQQTLGTRAAASFLRNAGFRLEAALAILATPVHAPRRHRSQL